MEGPTEAQAPASGEPEALRDAPLEHRPDPDVRAVETTRLGGEYVLGDAGAVRVVPGKPGLAALIPVIPADSAAPKEE